MKLRRFALLLAFLMCAGFALAIAQEAPQNPQTTQTEQKPKEAGQPGLAEQLAKTSNEAAGEEDETAAFKESPSVQWIARHTGLSPKAAYWVSIVLNFAIVAVVLAVVLKSKMPGVFRART